MNIFFLWGKCFASHTMCSWGLNSTQPKLKLINDRSWRTSEEINEKTEIEELSKKFAYEVKWCFHSWNIIEVIPGEAEMRMKVIHHDSLQKIVVCVETLLFIYFFLPEMYTAGSRSPLINMHNIKSTERLRKMHLTELGYQNRSWHQSKRFKIEVANCGTFKVEQSSRNRLDAYARKYLEFREISAQ